MRLLSVLLATLLSSVVLVTMTGAPVGASADPDGDGVTGADDRCPELDGSAGAEGCPYVTRTVKLRYQAAKTRFVGRISSPSAEFLKADKISVWMKDADDNGHPMRLGRTTSNAAGRFVFFIDASPGQYYVNLRSKVEPDIGLATQVKSRIVTVD